METLVPVTYRGVDFVYVSPPDAVAPAPTLVLLAQDGRGTLTTEPYCLIGRFLHENGWCVVSLDLPCHGRDRRKGEPPELSGWAERVRNGENIVASFQSRVRTVIEYLVNNGISDPKRIGAAGTSRGGFMAFHAAAFNHRIRAVAAFSPVTDLLALREFADQTDHALAHQLALIRSAERLADRAVWITIGHSDTRVGTENAATFARELERAASPRTKAPQVMFRIVQKDGHRSDPVWHREASDWMLRFFLRTSMINPPNKEPQ